MFLRRKLGVRALTKTKWRVMFGTVAGIIGGRAREFVAVTE